MALGKSFTNPQRIIDKSFNALTENTITQDTIKTMSGIEAGVIREKEFQAQQDQQVDTEQQGFYGKINKVPTTGNAALDNNIHAFWDDKADEYFKIKNAMDKGTISRQEGNRALTKIMKLADDFERQAKVLALESAKYKEDLKNGTVSSLGSPNTKNILNQLGLGGNVGIVERGGQLIYFTPEGVDAEGNKIPGSILNGSEAEAMTANGGQLYQNKVDISQNLATAFNKTYQPDQPNSQYVTTVTKTRNDWIDENDHSKGKFTQIPEGEEVTFQTITTDGKANGQKAMMESGVLDPLLNDPSVMQSYWQDTIPDQWLKDNGYAGIENTAWGVKPKDMSDDEWTKVQEKQNQAAKQYMANSAYDANSTMDQKLKYISRKKIVPPPPKDDKPTGPGLSQENSLVYRTRYDDYKQYNSDVDNLYSQGNPSSQQFVDFMKKYTSKNIFVIPADEAGPERIQLGKEIINMPETAEQAKEQINDLKGIDREMQILFSKKDPNEKSVDDYLNS